ncbi:carbon-nitrogen family hydrolase [Staphylococcus sp. 17KM0847]|uniref:carbon-nitrogen family hydrolase n=1 Tax=Staphylococcus sp. 17KM0847 TaxID=2583989 RepID=UPI0015DC64F1|nr:carbon-nitrogen family hydrolase [Staphylococcus sp. 17KM0847]QLK86453.1 carbon-nitrogen family hydrolase [Staphylococcus sp. 17KM0847]
MKVQVLQFYVTPANTKKNEQKITELFAQTIHDDTDIVVLPEMWNNGYALTVLQEKSDHSLSQAYPFIRQLAQQYNVDIIAGSVSNHQDGSLYNTAFNVLHDGTLNDYYHKIHLVPMLDEPQFLDAGDQVPDTFTLSNGTLASQIICYDLRFPEISRYPAAKGAEILFYVAQWPDTRQAHWRKLLQARAIENNAYIVAANGCGFDGQTTYAGHSMIINPNGDIIAEAQEDEATLTAVLDMHMVTEQRKAIPVFDNMRPEVYRYHFNKK